MATRIRLQVDESYPNCPKYIQKRQVTANLVGTDQPTLTVERGDALGPEQRAVITKADTLFVASVHPERGVDASHRGGNPGFVTIVDDRTLRIPDYKGNCMFNTFGNFVVNPRAGLIFVDFELHDRDSHFLIFHPRSSGGVPWCASWPWAETFLEGAYV